MPKDCKMNLDQIARLPPQVISQELSGKTVIADLDTEC
jgi:hypothetical protein